MCLGSNPIDSFCTAIKTKNMSHHSTELQTNSFKSPVWIYAHALRQNKQQGIRNCKDNKLVRNESDHDRSLPALYMTNNFIQIRRLGENWCTSHIWNNSCYLPVGNLLWHHVGIRHHLLSPRPTPLSSHQVNRFESIRHAVSLEVSLESKDQLLSVWSALRKKNVWPCQG